MTQIEKINAELKASMLARDADRTGALRMLKSAVGYVQIEKKVDVLPDADVLAVVQKEAKKRRDSIEEFDRGGRAELAAKERAELKDSKSSCPSSSRPRRPKTWSRPPSPRSAPPARRTWDR